MGAEPEGGDGTEKRKIMDKNKKQEILITAEYNGTKYVGKFEFTPKDYIQYDERLKLTVLNRDKLIADCRMMGHPIETTLRKWWYGLFADQETVIEAERKFVEEHVEENKEK